MDTHLHIKFECADINELLLPYRKDHISHLVYPLSTVLDDSIGCALWFAARGRGVLYSDQGNIGVQYTSTAKVWVKLEL